MKLSLSDKQVTFKQAERKYIGKCIYCGSTENLSNEHSIPESLNGQLILEKASCENCRRITEKFEARYTNETLKSARVCLGMKSKRSKKKQPKSFQLKLIKNETEKMVEVSKEDFIPVIPLYECGQPEKYSHIPHAKGLQPNEMDLVCFPVKSLEEMQSIAIKYDADKIQCDFPIYHREFIQMIAKIGYCYAIAQFGLNKIEENYILSGILGKSNDLGRWVGSDGNQSEFFKRGKFTNFNHLVETYTETDGTIIVRIKLFKDLQTPEYTVVVGRLSKFLLAIYKCAGYDVIE